MSTISTIFQHPTDPAPPIVNHHEGDRLIILPFIQSEIAWARQAGWTISLGPCEGETSQETAQIASQLALWIDPPPVPAEEDGEQDGDGEQGAAQEQEPPEEAE